MFGEGIQNQIDIPLVQQDAAFLFGFVPAVKERQYPSIVFLIAEKALEMSVPIQLEKIAQIGILYDKDIDFRIIPVTVIMRFKGFDNGNVASLKQSAVTVDAYIMISADDTQHFQTAVKVHRAIFIWHPHEITVVRHIYDGFISVFHLYPP